LQSESLINARKLLLFVCCIGQRGGDLLKITESNFVTRNGLEVIELKQQKTLKNVVIPILQETKNILKGGLPKSISIPIFNECIKKDKNGKYIKKGVKRTVKGTYPKYALTSAHICRRSFSLISMAFYQLF
jgi:integrase